MKKEYELTNNLVFDWVFRVRFDNLYKKPIENLTMLDNNNIYIPKHDNWGGYNDRFAFSSSSNMDKYAERYSYIDEYYQNGERKLHPETFLKWYIDEKVKIPIARTDLEHYLFRYNETWVAQYGN